MIETLTLDYSHERTTTRRRVLLVDDHAVVRKGLAMLINDEADMQVCGEAEDERGAREAAASLRPDVAVVDWSLGHMDAAGLIKAFHDSYPGMPVLVLSMHEERHYVERVPQAGASGYVMKRDASERVIEGIRRTAAGDLYFSERAIDALSAGVKAALLRNIPGHERARKAARRTDEPAKSDLVIAPHPDDETFGCGGTIRLMADGGANVDLAFMTRGELGHVKGSEVSADKRVALAYERTNEAVNACKALGARQISFLNGSDSRLKEQGHLAEDLLTIMGNGGYRRIFCPWKHDDRDDHSATFSMLQVALRSYEASPQVWLYEVWTPQQYNMLIPIDQTIRQKRSAIECYRSQLLRSNCREGLIGLSAYRGAFCPPANFAEAFFVCGKDEMLSL